MPARSAFFFARVFLGCLVLLGGLAARAEELTLSFEQRFLLSFALDAATSPPERRTELMVRMAELRAHSAGAVENVAVSSYEEFLKSWRGEWPETDTLSRDIDQIMARKSSLRRAFLASTPALQKRIDAYIAEQPGKVLDLVTPFAAQALNAVGADLASPQGLDKLMKEAPTLLAEQSARVEEILGRVMEKAFATAKDPLLRIGMKVVFSRYYSQLSVTSKARLASALLGVNLKSDLNGFFAVFLQNSGPQVQKMVQVVARMGTLDPKLSELFRTLESDVKPVPFSQVREILAKETSYEFVSFEQKPLGVGTMAQVHRAVLRENGRDVPVVVRFLKPGIAKRVEEDHGILTRIAAELDVNPEFRASGVPKISPLIEEVTNTVRAELDLEATIDRQVEARKVYETTRRAVSENRLPVILNFHVPSVHRIAGHSSLHVQEQVSGRKLEKVVEDMKGSIPDLEKLVARETARLWIQEALFGSGFYHSDLHQGNFLVDVRDTELTISLLDYGMAGKVPRAMQDQMLVLAAALALNKDAAIADAFHGLSDAKKNKIGPEDLRRAVARENAEIRAGRQPARGLIEWTAFMVDHGVALSYDVVNLNRGAAIVDQMMTDAGIDKGFSKVAMELAVRSPVRVMGALLRNGFTMKDLARLGLERPNVELSTTKFGAPSAGGAVRCEAVF